MTEGGDGLSARARKQGAHWVAGSYGPRALAASRLLTASLAADVILDLHCPVTAYVDVARHHAPVRHPQGSSTQVPSWTLECLVELRGGATPERLHCRFAFGLSLLRSMPPRCNGSLASMGAHRSVFIFSEQDPRDANNRQRGRWRAAVCPPIFVAGT